MNEMVRITARDMVAVALKPLKAGEIVSCGDEDITLAEDLPMGHKAALREIRKGEAVYKYGEVMGVVLSSGAKALFYTHYDGQTTEAAVRSWLNSKAGISSGTP